MGFPNRTIKISRNALLSGEAGGMDEAVVQEFSNSDINVFWLRKIKKKKKLNHKPNLLTKQQAM